MKSTRIVVLAGVLAVGIVACAPNPTRLDGGAGASSVATPTLEVQPTGDSGPWPMLGHDARRTSLSENTGPAIPTVKWRFATGGAVFSSPAVAGDGTVYVASRSARLYALNPDGTKKWSFELQDETDSSPAVARDGTIYVGSGSRPETPFRVGGAADAQSPHARLWAVNPDGTKKWEFATGNTVSSAAVASDGTVYVQGDALHAISADGVQKWRLPVGRGGTIGGPTIGRDGTLYVCGAGGSAHAVTPNGRVVWEFKTRAKGWMRFSPAAAADGTIYVYATGVLYAIRPDGSEKWTVETRGGAAQSTPAIAKDGTVYVRFGGELCAIDPAGREKWRSKLGEVPSGSGYEGSFAVPAVGGDGTVYVDGFQKRMVLCAIDPTGKRKWSLPGHGGVASSPAIGAGGTIYFGASDGEIVAVGEAK